MRRDEVAHGTLPKREQILRRMWKLANAGVGDAVRLACFPQEEWGRLEDMDLDILRSVNGDVVGWIVIPGTKVNYPVLQKNDNDYYLTRTWKGESSSVGSIFVDYRNTPGFGDDNTLIYGHNMRNGSMFGGLKYYINDGHWEAHPSIYLVDDAGVHRYDIYAVYEARVDAVTYEMNFADDQAKTDFIHYGIRRSVVDTDIVPAAEDRIITLSTCTGMGYTTRWVIHARLPMIELTQ